VCAAGTRSKLEGSGLGGILRIEHEHILHFAHWTSTHFAVAVNSARGERNEKEIRTKLGEPAPRRTPARLRAGMPKKVKEDAATSFGKLAQLPHEQAAQGLVGSFDLTVHSDAKEGVADRFWLSRPQLWTFLDYCRLFFRIF